MKKPLWRDGWLMAICVGRILMYMNYMVYAACLPILKSEWGMSATQAGSIVSGFMIGYAASLAVASWLSDHFGARRIFVLSAVTSTVTALLFGFFARDYPTTLILHSLLGIAQGGIYTPGIVLMAERFPVDCRGALSAGLLQAHRWATHAPWPFRESWLLQEAMCSPSSVRASCHPRGH